MVPPPDSLRRHFLPWDRSLLGQTVEFLASGWDGRGALDLSSCLVIVPTGQSGRRLREALAASAGKRGQAVFSPRVVTPNALLTLDPLVGVASRLESLLAWAEVFSESDLDDFREVFPVDPPARTFSWALRLARDFLRLQTTLAEANLGLGDVVERAGENFAEAARWAQIGQLEQRQRSKLSVLGLRNEPDARRQQMITPALPGGIAKIVLLATPDPMPLALEAISHLAKEVPVEVVIFAPISESASFDGWGRPLAESWGKRELILPEFEQRVRPCADPAAQAERVVALAKDYGSPAGVLGVGVADPELLPLLGTGLRRAGFTAFDPAGRPRHGDRLFQLLSALAALRRDDSFSVIEVLARCPDFLEFLKSRLGESFTSAAFLTALDKLRTRSLPPTLKEAGRHWPGSRELAAITELRGKLREGSFPENATDVLALLFANRRLDLTQPTGAAFAQSAQAWSSVVEEIANAKLRFGDVSEVDWWEIALLVHGESEISAEKPDGALELQGWLELLWDDSPHLVIAGMNDGLVPDAVVGDPFLPESLRERLKLKTNAERLARDAYLLQALAASRSNGGQLDLLLGKASATGDPLRPSRLLFRCPDEELPGRVRSLFRPLESAKAGSPWQRAWRLAPPLVPAPAKVAVTALRAWLECPFRFYLSRVLRMEAVDPAKTELDALDFGTVCHAALEAMGKDATMRHCTDAPVLREFLLHQLELEGSRRFGRQLALPLVIQMESARQRLSRAAEVQAQLRAEGWMIERIEQPFELAVGGLVVSGKIDRVDRHEHTGAIRLLDYKTSDQATTPLHAHLRRARPRDREGASFTQLALDDGDYVWSDLQLPFYLRALAGEFPGVINCGYFNLPKASGESGLALWEDFSREMAESAWRCAEGVAGAIHAGQFWPPNEEVPARFDRFVSLFHHGVAESVAWEGPGQ